MKTLIAIGGLAAAVVMLLPACSTANNSGPTTGPTYKNDLGPQSTVPFPDSPGSSPAIDGPIPNPAGSGNQPETPAH